MQDATHRTALEKAWREPGQRPDASWFPAVLDGFTLRTTEALTAMPELQLDRPGWRGKYRGEKQDEEVTILPVSDLERDGIFDRAASMLEANSQRVITGGGDHSSFKITTNSGHLTTRSGNRFYIKVNGDEHTRLWWIKDWLFIFRTTGPDDPDAFADKFIEAMKPVVLEKP